MLFFVYFFRNLPFQNVFHDCGSSYQDITTSVPLNKTSENSLQNVLPTVDSIATEKMSKVAIFLHCALIFKPGLIIK